MSFPFDAAQRLIIIKAHLWGPEGDALLRLALDTGASYSLVREDLLRVLGYDRSSANPHIQIATASGIESLAQIRVDKVEALGEERREFRVLCHTLPSSANLDGLLGLDFFQGAPSHSGFSGRHYSTGMN